LLNERTTIATTTAAGTLIGYGLARAFVKNDRTPYVVLGGLFGTMGGEWLLQNENQNTMPKQKKKTNCDPSPACSTHGRALRRGRSESGSAMNKYCKPEAKARRKRGCLNGLNGIDGSISKRAKQIRRKGESWKSAMRRASKQLNGKGGLAGLSGMDSGNKMMLGAVGLLAAGLVGYAIYDQSQK
jgi:hypothetical protein